MIETMLLLTQADISVKWITKSFSNFIHFARQEMAENFMKSEDTDLIFIDDDMGWRAEDLFEMLLHDVDVVGAICPLKREREQWNVNLLHDPAGNRVECDGLLEAAYVGTAIMRIQRRAFERFDPFSHFFDARYEPSGMIGEDAWFCRELRKRGGSVWAMPMQVRHIGIKQWFGNYEEKAQCQAKKC